MDVIKDIAKSFYHYYKLGEVSFGLEDISQLSMEQAYQCQDAFLKLRENDGDQPFGYKVGCTSAAIREQFGFDEPIYGRLMTPGKLFEQDSVEARNYDNLAIEPEFVITMKRDLYGVPESEQELIDAIDTIRPGIELHNYTYHFSPPTRQELICSNGIHVAQLVGSHAVEASAIHWELEGVAVFKNQKLVASGVAADIMGGPLNSLKFLLSHLKSRDQKLAAGEMVIPGSATALIPVEAGDEVECRFTNAGSVKMTVT